MIAATCAGRYILLALFILVAVTTSASAESAWVLWEGELSNVESSWVWLISGTYLTARDCDVGLADEVRARRKLGYKVTEPVARTASYTVSEQGKTVHGRLHCLPDTVDPRGPKGK